jgi:hypothetical protein
LLNSLNVSPPRPTPKKQCDQSSFSLSARPCDQWQMNDRGFWSSLSEATRLRLVSKYFLSRAEFHSDSAFVVHGQTRLAPPCSLTKTRRVEPVQYSFPTIKMGWIPHSQWIIHQPKLGSGRTRRFSRGAAYSRRAFSHPGSHHPGIQGDFSRRP